MSITKVTFTTVDDTPDEKTTIVNEFGPFDSTDAHPVEAFFEWLQNKDKPKDETPEIITS